jgi:hypothetical protein
VTASAIPSGRRKTGYVGGQVAVGDLLAIDVETEALTLQAAPVGELDLEVELDTVAG